MGVTISEEENAILGENMRSASLTPLWIVKRTGPCTGVHKIGADAWLQALDEIIIGRKGVGVGLHTAGKVWYLRLACYLW